MKLTVTKFSQNDPKWSGIKLGTSTVSTIGNFGCLLTCAAMLCKYFGKDTDPQRLNEAMKKVGGFYNGSYWIWGKLSEVYPDISFDWDIYNKGNFEDIPADLTMLDKLLEQKIPAIVKVDFTPGGEVNEHWVLVVGKETDYIVNDPWTGEEYYFAARYGDPSRYIFNIRAYRGQIPNEGYKLFYQGVELKTYDRNPEDIITEAETRLKTANDQLAAKVLEADGYREELRRQEAENLDLSQQLATARRERDRAATDLKTAEIRVDDLERGMLSSQEEITALRERLEGLTGTTLDQYTAAELVIDLVKRLFNKK